MTEATVFRIHKPAMAAALRDLPEFAELFTAFLLKRNIRFEADLVDHLFNSTEKRLARILLRLSNLGKEGKMEQVITTFRSPLRTSQDVIKFIDGMPADHRLARLKWQMEVAEIAARSP